MARLPNLISQKKSRKRMPVEPKYQLTILEEDVKKKTVSAILRYKVTVLHVINKLPQL